MKRSIFTISVQLILEKHTRNNLHIVRFKIINENVFMFAIRVFKLVFTTKHYKTVD